MKARLVKFGEIEVEGKCYTHDVVIDGGKVRKRKKGPSKQFREKFGHTPLSAGEEIPWGGKQLIVGTGAHGALPVMDEVLAEAKRRGIDVMADERWERLVGQQGIVYAKTVAEAMDLKLDMNNPADREKLRRTILELVAEG